ncbi:AMP-binding protein [Marinilabiliaceae bacterium ANBcel2]|nr:AMP-binding protein [Marinilabiliaceae bacterium ANBcel2]
MRPYIIIDTTKSFSKLADNETTVNWQVELYAFIQQWLNLDQHITVQTSGSTGAPLKIKMPKSAMRASALRTLSYFELNTGMTSLLCLPTSFIAGKMQVVRAFVGGLKIIAVEPSSVPLLNVNEAIDFAAFTPMQMLEQLNYPDTSKLQLLKKVIIGGGKISSELDKMLQQQPFEAYETYGMTETLTHIAIRKINGNNPQNSFTPLKSVEISTDNRGCLQIKAPYITNQTIKTNDLATIFANGSFSITGRIDNIINSGGIKLSPERIEECIAHLIKLPFVISSIPHKTMGEQLVLVTEGELLTPENILNQIKKEVSKYEVPTAIINLKKLPRTISGKIQRNKVKEMIYNNLNT